MPIKTNIQEIRRLFPALQIADRGVPRIYFDNPAGTQVPDSVITSMSRCLRATNANLGGPFVTSRGADAVVAEAHLAMADLLNAASPDEIIFGQNMTTLTLHMSRSIAQVLEPGDEILLTRMDHDANVTPWTLMARDHGLKVQWLPFDPHSGEFDLDIARKALSGKVRLMCVGAASNLLGTLNDVRSLCRFAREAGAMTYIDAVQSVPHVSTDVQDLGCDFLACSAYKFFGPHQGILYGRREVLERLSPYKVRPASDTIPDCFETGTQSHEGMAGTAAAVDYFAALGERYGRSYIDRYAHFSGRRQAVHAAMDMLFDYETGLARQLIDGLQSISGVTVHGVRDPQAMSRRVPTVAFTSNRHAPDQIARHLGANNIFVWSGHNYALEVVDMLGLRDSGGVVRVGPVHYNTASEIDAALTLIAAMH